MRNEREKALSRIEKGLFDWPDLALDFPEWEPFFGFPRFRRAIGRMMRNYFREMPFIEDFKTPEIDLYEDKGNLIAEIELPGVSKKDIEIHADEDSLSIKGQFKKTEEIQEENFYRQERRFGSFSRTLSLPKTIDPQKVSASFKEGILKVTMPTIDKDEGKGRKISIE